MRDEIAAPAAGVGGPIDIAPVTSASAEALTITKQDFSWRSDRQAWWAVILLTMSFTLSLLDRTILALFIEPIKTDLALTDTEIGLLVGTAFGLFYVLCGIPLGWLADRVSRRHLIGLSVLGWSVASFGCGLAKTPAQLFAGRFCVGIGEAGLAPSAISMVTDYFPREKLARPLGFMTLGSTVGTGLTLLFGGALVSYSHAVDSLPLLGPIRGWQAVLIVLGIFGVAFSLLYLTIKEPPRTSMVAAAPVSNGALWQFIKPRFGFVFFLMVGMAMNQVALVSYVIWLPSHFIRALGWPASDTGYLLGSIIVLASLLAVSSIDSAIALMKRWQPAGPILAVARAASAVAILPAFLTPLVSSIWLAGLSLFFMVFFSLLSIAVGPAVIQPLAPNNIRGQLAAVQTIVIGVLASMTGPVVVATLTDQFFEDPARVGESLAITAIGALSAAILLLHGARKAYLRLPETVADAARHTSL